MDSNARQSPRTLSTADQQAILAQLDQTLESAGIYLASEIRDGALILSGQTITPGDHEAALDVAHALVDPLGLTIEDAIEDIDEEVIDYNHDALRDAITSGPVGSLKLNLDFNGDAGTTDSQRSAEETITYFPPTDPVVRTQDALDDDDGDGIEVVGGFAETALDEDDDAATVYPSIDDDLAEAVMRELLQDAATADLASQIRVSTRGGVVLLTGQVETLEDSDEAAAVAERVDGVVEVREELTVTILPHLEKPGE